MIKLFRATHYIINLKPTKVMDKIKSITVSSYRLQNISTEFTGTFFVNTFKVQFANQNNILVHNSINPIFYGSVTSLNSYTHLTIKMRPNSGGYLMFLLPLSMWITLLICALLSVPNTNLALIPITIFLVGFVLIVFGILDNKYHDMIFAIEDLFKNNIVV